MIIINHILIPHTGQLSKQEDERETKAGRKVSIAAPQESMPDAKSNDAGLTKEN